MKTLNIKISDNEFERLGFESENLSFTEFFELVNKDLIRQNLNKSIELAEKYGLSSLSMDEITEEVKSMRADAKNRN